MAALYISNSEDETINYDVSSSHRDVFKYTKEVEYEADAEFGDETIAGKIVDYFHKWIHVDLHPRIHYDTGMSFNKGHLGIINDFDYCKKSDIYKL